MKTIEAFGTTMSDLEFLARTNEKQDAKKKGKVKMQRKRQRLYAKVRHFTQIFPRQKLILITQETLDNLASDQRKVLDSLINVYGFKTQFELA